MPRRKRRDEPDTWHHVFNRATGKRPLFLCPEDFRYFLARLARAVRSGVIEVHAFALLLNHFHLLVRSTKGRLAAAMHDIQMFYARYLNRRLRRDGPLFRDRYKSRRVDTEAYHRTLVSYIDGNPVHARLVARPEDHLWSSAIHYRSPRRPKWLATAWIDASVMERTGRNARHTSSYRKAFPLRVDPGFQSWIERRLETRGPARDDLDIMLGADPKATLAWMRRQAKLADGEEVALPLASAVAILAEIGGRRLTGLAKLPSKGPAPDAAELLSAGLLRDVARLPWAEIARRTGRTLTTARNRWLCHRRRVCEERAYAGLAAAITRAAVRATVGAPHRPRCPRNRRASRPGLSLKK